MDQVRVLSLTSTVHGAKKEAMMDRSEQAKELRETGSLVLTDPNGRRIFFVLSTVLAGKDLPPGVLISYEKGGSFYWDGGKELTKFILFQHGFSALIAPVILGVLREILNKPEVRPTAQVAIEDHRTEIDPSNEEVDK
jgi:hypothetical protein